MSVRISGEKQLNAELARRFGTNRMAVISDAALKRGAAVFVAELKRQFETFKDTGESIREITVSEPMWVGSARMIKVYWRGPKNRYRIIHLNEWGTVQNPHPRGKGAIARAMRNCQHAYREAIKQAIREGI